MLTLTNARKAFGKTVAVDGLSLSVRKGELFGLLGPNGAGKSTTASLAVGLLTPESSSVAISIILVEVILLAVAMGFGVRPSSFAMLALAGVSSAVCFVGFMMLVASLGKTEQTAAGAGWAILMPLSMLGGAMVPLFVMPQWMQTVGLAYFAVGTRGLQEA